MSDCTCPKHNVDPGLDCAVLDRILADYAKVRASLVPVLQATQRAYGYLPEFALEAIADSIGLPLAEVLGVATFYGQFHLEPRGRHIVQVCHGTACHVKGAVEVTTAIASELSVEMGQTASDGSVTLESVSCVGCCALAPVVLIDEVAHGGLDARSARRLVRTLRVKAAE